MDETLVCMLAVRRRLSDNGSPNIAILTMSPSSANAAGTVIFVACVKTKREDTAAAKDLYVSDWFKKARRYVEARGLPWFILSAKHGLVAPDYQIERYGKTLKEMCACEKRDWADGVLGAISREIPDLQHAIFLAGRSYRELLTSELKKRGVKVEVPMEGLRSGQQLQWLKAHSA